MKFDVSRQLQRCIIVLIHHPSPRLLISAYIVEHKKVNGYLTSTLIMNE